MFLPILDRISSHLGVFGLLFWYWGAGCGFVLCSTCSGVVVFHVTYGCHGVFGGYIYMVGKEYFYWLCVPERVRESCVVDVGRTKHRVSADLAWAAMLVVVISFMLTW